MSGQHARLSASAAHRWLHCPGSIKLSEGAPDSTSIHAAAGTYAHSIAAACLDGNLKPGTWLGKKETVDGHEITCDQEMVDAVQVYLDDIAEDAQIGDINKAEMPLLAALQQIDPDLGGTADYVRYRPSTKHLRVMDFKFGSGMYVEADDNDQAKIYGLGALLALNVPVKEVEVGIVQPRFEGAKPVRTWVFPVKDILDFVADVREAADKTRLPDPPLAAGDWCKFCKAARTCPELEKQQHALTAVEFGTITDYKQLSQALISVPLIKERIKAIEEFAYTEAQAGRFGEEHGFKLVDKRPARKWKSEGDVIEWAQANAVDPYAPREILSVAQLEKKLGESAPKGKKKEAGKVLEPFVEKISSGTVLVPVSDDRAPAKRISAEDFTRIDGIVSN